MRGVKRYFREPYWAFIFTVNRELCLIFFMNRELTSPYFLCDSWIDFYFLREPWIGILYFPCDSWLTSFLFPWTVNFAYYLREFSNFPPKIHMSLIVMIRNWCLMIDICLLLSEMWRRLATISYLELNYESWHNAYTSEFKRDYTRVSKGGFRGQQGVAPPPPFSVVPPLYDVLESLDLGEGEQGVGLPPFFKVVPPPFFWNFSAHTILILSNDLFFTML